MTTPPSKKRCKTECELLTTINFIAGSTCVCRQSSDVTDDVAPDVFENNIDLIADKDDSTEDYESVSSNETDRSASEEEKEQQEDDTNEDESSVGSVDKISIASFYHDNCNDNLVAEGEEELEMPKDERKLQYKKWKNMKGNGIFPHGCLEKQVQTKLVCACCIEDELKKKKFAKDVRITNATLKVTSIICAFVCSLTVECHSGLHSFTVEPRCIQ